jgi:hypothetical protein
VLFFHTLKDVDGRPGVGQFEADYYIVNSDHSKTKIPGFGPGADLGSPQFTKGLFELLSHLAQHVQKNLARERSAQ